MPKTIRESKADIVRITLTERDGSERVLTVTGDLHYLLAFSTVGKLKRGGEYPMEILVKGDPRICGEMFYQMGVVHPPLVEHVARKATRIIGEARKASALDTMMEDASPTGGTQ